METSIIAIEGDVSGHAFDLRVLRFAGRDPAAPKAYLQAALHGEEMPGAAALHYLIPLLAAAEREGHLAGDITVVPYANPLGLAQEFFGQHQGRFHAGSRINFNREIPLATSADADLPALDGVAPVDRRLKAQLIRLSRGHDIILDLHCDDESLSYVYLPRKLWPHGADLAAALGSRAVLTWENTDDGTFEEASFAPYADRPDTDPVFRRVMVSTVELRGVADVRPDLAQADADGLFRFLVGRGVIRGRHDPVEAFSGPVVPLENAEMLRTAVSGAILYHAAPGDVLAAGDPVCSILRAPGEEDGAVVLRAPQAGLVLTRRCRRFARRGDDVAKLLGSTRSAGARPGSLES